MKKLILGIVCCVLVTLVAANADLHPDISEDARLTTTELARKYGYPAEEHIVLTRDGYLLELHRIPGSPQSPPAPGKPVAFLMHGMLSSSADFILMGVETSLVYMLADLGYDVWLGNARGNRYSRRHISISPETSQFWQFSWHEVGTEDLPSSIDYVLQTTGHEQLHYIGHSQGTTVFWVMCAERPEYNSRILSMQALAPAAYMHHTRSPYIIWLSSFLTSTTIALQWMGVHYFAPTSEMDILAGEEECRDGAPTQEMCANTIFLLAGYNSEEMNMTMLPVKNAHSPAGASTMQMIHFGQITRSQIFRQYDHGAALNQIHYGSLTPPRYDLSRVTAPVALYHSQNDWIAGPEDVALLYADLPNVVRKYMVPLPAFNHMDFVWAINVRNWVYNSMISHMRQMEVNAGM